jgi:outer membrane protein OmpA-like peptidoglycan-associated protein
MLCPSLGRDERGKRHKENTMLNRRSFTTALIAAVVLPGAAFAQAQMPSATTIERQLDATPRMRVNPNQRVTVQEFKRRPDLRRAAPSIDIQSINFEFASAEIAPSQYRKVESIASAMNRILRRDRRARFLIEGHTDAVGSYQSNQVLSERRAESLKRVLSRQYGVPSRALETVGYGKEFLLVPTQNENWRNRRVTLRRIDSFIR